MILKTSINQPRLLDVKNRIHELEAELSSLRQEEIKLEAKELKPGEWWRLKAVYKTSFRLVQVLKVEGLLLHTNKGLFSMDMIVLKRSEREQDRPGKTKHLDD